MTLFRQRVSSFQVVGLEPEAPVFDKEGKPCPLPPLSSEAISIKAGEVVLVVSLSKDKKAIEVSYVPNKAGKAHDHQSRSGRDGAVLQVTL